MRIAAIDIGTNSVRSTIVEVPVGGPRRTLDDEKAYTRLGRGTGASGQLSDEAMDETIEVLDRMLQIAGQHEVTHVRAVATAAVRDAANGEEFVERVRDELGLAIEVISAKEEGRLAFLSAAESIGLDGRSAVVDIGGGSVEIVRATDRQIEFISSLPIGAVVMSERYHTRDPIPDKELKRMRRYVRRTLTDVLGTDPDPVGTFVGSGGTINTVAALIAAKRDPSISTLHSFEVLRAEVIHLKAALAATTAQERAEMKGMPVNRVDIIVAGVVVLDEVMRVLGANELIVNGRGVREGVVIDTVERERGATGPFDKMHSVREFARACHADVAHAEQVRRFALEIFDGLAPVLGLAGGHRHLLEAAALLHDVGYHIAYERHHKHSYHLISYAGLPGFTAREHRLIATIARYHRGALPKSRHEGFRDLGREDRRLVEQLAAILRLGDGLDRSRGQKVDSVSLDMAPKRLTFALRADVPLDVEVHGAQRKADLFERAFGMRVDIVEVPPFENEKEGVSSSG